MVFILHIPETRVGGDRWVCAMSKTTPRLTSARKSGSDFCGFFSKVITACALVVLLSAGSAKAWNSDNATGAMPPLAFTMTRATDGKQVTAAAYKAKIVLLYFGYTNCPDVCPTTLFNIGQMLKSMDKKANDVRVLFVTVDPNRDTLSILKKYGDAFAPQVVGLRGTPKELAALAKRYHAWYTVTPAHNGKPYEVTHSPGVYVFNREGAIKLIITNLAQPNVKLAPTLADLRAMVAGAGSSHWWRRVLSML
jgi:protein SCO1